MSSTQTSHESISTQDLETYLSYIITGQVESTDQAKKLSRLSRRSTTLADVAVVVQSIIQSDRDRIMQIMDAIQVTNIVLKKLGATEEHYADARVEYDETIEAARKRLEEEHKKLQEQSEGKE